MFELDHINLVIICHNTQWLNVKFDKVGIWFHKITHISSLESGIWALCSPIYMKNSAKVKLGQVDVGSNIQQNHSPVLNKSYIVII